MSEITIDPEIANLCRSLTDEERAGLESSIRSEGCRDALVLWGDLLLDGHNRYEICASLGKECRTAQVGDVETREQAINWVISNQLSRRNLTPTEASYLRGKRYNAEKLSPEARASLARASQLSATPENRVEPGSVQDSYGAAGRLAREFGVAHSTISDDGLFAAAVDAIAENVDPQEARDIRSGKAQLTKTAVRQIAKQPAEKQAEAIQQAKKAKRMRAHTRQQKPKQSVPTDLGMFVMWLNAGSMHAARFETGAALNSYAAQHGVELRADHIDEIHWLLSGLIAAREAGRAA